MTKLLKSLLLALGIAGLMTGAAYAKEESKQTSAKEESKQASKQSSAKDAAKTSGSSDAGSTASSKTATPLDINTASEKELAALPKIGDAKAKAIVKNRPYSGKDALVDKKILSKSEYDAIKDQIVAKKKAASSDTSSGKSSSMSSDKSSAKTASKSSDKKN